MVYSSCTVAVSNRTKLLAFYTFETQEEEKEESTWEGREIHYNYYKHTENFIFPKFLGSARGSVWDDQVGGEIENG